MKISPLLNHIALSLVLVGAISFTGLEAKTLKPIGKHLKDALKINEFRAPLYAELSKGKSLKLSHELMAMETVALLWLSHLDYKAQPYLKAGVGVFEDDLIDMKETPEFLPHFEDNNPPVMRKSFDVKGIAKSWSDKIKNNEFEGVYVEAVDLLSNSDLKETNQNCLTRHFIESIARSIKNHEGHRQQALLAGLSDPREILVSFLTAQIISLRWAQSLDHRAFDVQKNNIPLFCRDVPFIPYE